MQLIDYTDKYFNLVTFNPNKNLPIHKWYPLVEGFSSELVKDIIQEQNNRPNLCLDIFGGVGTTALTCFELNIESISIEASPFFYDVSRAKLNYSLYKSVILEKLIIKIESILKTVRGNVSHPELESKTFFENTNNDKWIFHKSVSNGIFDISKTIDIVCKDHIIYKSLFKVSLSTILQEVSNVFKNGKCLSYKKNWKNKKYSRKEVHGLFLNHIRNVILNDIKDLNTKEKQVVNYNIIKGDSRNKIKELVNGIDLVITSPPYLNSRDYTDIYRLELWMLGYISNYKNERIMREAALTSHVQIQLPKVNYPDVPELMMAINFLESEQASLWNKNIPNMVRGYFKDIENILIDLKPKLNLNAMIYINVSNSSYSNYIIEVDVIIAKIAELVGYNCQEIRIARPIKTSSQQSYLKDKTKMRESIIVLSNN